MRAVKVIIGLFTTVITGYCMFTFQQLLPDVDGTKVCCTIAVVAIAWLCMGLIVGFENGRDER